MQGTGVLGQAHPRCPCMSRPRQPRPRPSLGTFLAPSFSAFFLASSKSSFWPMLAWEQRQRGREPGEGGEMGPWLSWTLSTPGPSSGGVRLTAKATQEEGAGGWAVGCATQSPPGPRAG